MIKNSPEEGSPPLSAFEESVFQYIERIKTNYNIAKEQHQIAREKYTLVKYFEKYLWVIQYINDIEIFHINELYDYVKDAKDISGDRSKKMPDRKTISRYLNLLFKEELLGHKPVPSNYPNMYKFYWIPQISEEKRKNVLQSIFDSYKEPKPHKKEKRKQQHDNTVQSRLVNYDANIEADDLIAEKEKQRLEKQKLERQKQRDLERQQKELEKAAENKAKVKTLQEHAKKTRQKKSKKTKNGSRILTEEELKANFKKNQKEIEIAQEEKEYQVVKEKRAREKTVSEEGG
ncbi:MAG: hypothetical protein GPJ52_01920 [Candidatus Heimdallarchaeota archaeon]|nr:hypothetical protein [Candidatus Heimdallarchaeota archaeon]